MSINVATSQKLVMSLLKMCLDDFKGEGILKTGMHNIMSKCKIMSISSLNNA